MWQKLFYERYDLMGKILVTMPVSAEDVEQFANIMEMENDGNFLKSFSERFLQCVKSSCENIRKTADEADAFNPYCMR